MKNSKKGGFKGFDNNSSKKLKRKKPKTRMDWLREGYIMVTNAQNAQDLARGKTNPELIYDPEQAKKQLEIEEKVDRQTAKNQNDPQAYENFMQLVNEGNSEKLASYFEQYGISRERALSNLHSLIQEELRDLSNG